MQKCPLTINANSVLFKAQRYTVRDEKITNVELMLGSTGVHVVAVYEGRCYTDLAFIVPYVDNKTDYSALSDIFVSIMELNRAILKSLDRLI